MLGSGDVVLGELTPTYGIVSYVLRSGSTLMRTPEFGDAVASISSSGIKVIGIPAIFMQLNR